MFNPVRCLSQSVYIYQVWVGQVIVGSSVQSDVYHSLYLCTVR